MRHEHLLGETVRVLDGPGVTVRAEGKLIAIIPEPVLVIEDDEGNRHYESPNLPIFKRQVVWEQQS